VKTKTVKVLKEGNEATELVRTPSLGFFAELEDKWGTDDLNQWLFSKCPMTASRLKDVLPALLRDTAGDEEEWGSQSFIMSELEAYQDSIFTVCWDALSKKAREGIEDAWKKMEKAIEEGDTIPGVIRLVLGGAQELLLQEYMKDDEANFIKAVKEVAKALPKQLLERVEVARLKEKSRPPALLKDEPTETS